LDDGWTTRGAEKTYLAMPFLESAGLLRLRRYVATPFLGKTQIWICPDASYGVR
jgi:hypothetical protein